MKKYRREIFATLITIVVLGGGLFFLYLKSYEKFGKEHFGFTYDNVPLFQAKEYTLRFGAILIPLLEEQLERAKKLHVDLTSILEDPNLLD